jgi:tripartite-type tricarboxylate transporter receptor subunit TctC
MSIRNSAAAALCVMALAYSGTGYSAYPEEPVHIIVPFSPGGGTDIPARVLADSLHDSMHQTFIVDNKPGAS